MKKDAVIRFIDKMARMISEETDRMHQLTLLEVAVYLHITVLEEKEIKACKVQIETIMLDMNPHYFNVYFQTPKPRKNDNGK